MKKSFVKLLFIISLIGDKINRQQLVQKGVMTDREIDYLIDQEHVSVEKNKQGEWLYINPLNTQGSAIIKVIDTQSDILSSLFPY